MGLGCAGESVGFVVGLDAGLGDEVEEERSFVVDVGEGLVRDVELRVDVGERVGLSLVETAADKPFLVVSSVPSTRLLTFTHSASTSATISPPPDSESKLRIDEMSPSNVLNLSLVGGLADSLTFVVSSDEVGSSSDGGGGCSDSDSSGDRGAGRGVRVRFSLMISTLLEREARRGGPGTTSSPPSLSFPCQRTLPNRPFKPFLCLPGL